MVVVVSQATAAQIQQLINYNRLAWLSIGDNSSGNTATATTYCSLAFGHALRTQALQSFLCSKQKTVKVTRGHKQ